MAYLPAFVERVLRSKVCDTTNRNPLRVIAHCDVDAAYAQCEFA